MSAFEVIITIILTLFAGAFILLAVKGKFTIRIERHIVEKKELSPIELEVAKRNLEALAKYNETEAKKQEENSGENMVRSVTEAVQQFFEVNNESESDPWLGIDRTGKQERE